MHDLFIGVQLAT